MTKKPLKISIEDIQVGEHFVEEVTQRDLTFEKEKLSTERAERDHQLAMHRHAEEVAKIANELAISRLKDREADRKMRTDYAGRILRYLEGYSLTVAAMVLASGYKLWGFALPIEILASLVGSTALAAIGLVGFIARGLFQPPTSI